MIENPKATIISVYFGKLPNYFEFTKKTIQHNKDFQWIIAGDMFEEKIEDGNILFLPFSLKDLSDGCAKVLNAEIDIKTPYKACDTKILWPEIFESYVFSDWVGWADLDCIFGDLNTFITEDVLINYDVITYTATSVYGQNVPSVHGPFTVINNKKIKKWYFDIPDLINKLNYNQTSSGDQRASYVGLDEVFFAKIIEEKKYKVFNRYKPFKEQTVDLPIIFYGRRRAPAKWRDGKIFIDSVQEDYDNRFNGVHSMFLHIRNNLHVDILNQEVLPEALHFYKDKKVIQIYKPQISICSFIKNFIPTIKFLHKKLMDIVFSFNEEQYINLKQIIDIFLPEVKITLDNNGKQNTLTQCFHLTQIPPGIIEEMRSLIPKKAIGDKAVFLSVDANKLQLLELLNAFAFCDEVTADFDDERHLMILMKPEAKYIDFCKINNSNFENIFKQLTSITAKKRFYVVSANT